MVVLLWNETNVQCIFTIKHNAALGGNGGIHKIRRHILEIFNTLPLFPRTPPPFLNKNGSTGTDYNFNVKPFGDMFSTQYNQIWS